MVDQELEGNISHSEIRRRNGETTALQRELTAVRREKNVLEIDLHSSQRKVVQLQHEISLANRDLERLRESFGKQSEDQIAQSQHLVHSLTSALDHCKKEINLKTEVISEIRNENIQTKRLLAEMANKLKGSERKMDQLSDLTSKELELKTTTIRALTKKFDEYQKMMRGQVADQVHRTVEDLSAKLEVLEVENANLKQVIKELKRDLALAEERANAQKDISIVRASNENKLMTQGTLILDFNKLFGTE